MVFLCWFFSQYSLLLHFSFSWWLFMSLVIFSLRAQSECGYENFELGFHRRPRSSERIGMVHNIRSIGSLFEDLYDSSERPQKRGDLRVFDQSHSLQKYGCSLWELHLIFSLLDWYSQDCSLLELHHLWFIAHTYHSREPHSFFHPLPKHNSQDLSLQVVLCSTHLIEVLLCNQGLHQDQYWLLSIE